MRAPLLKTRGRYRRIHTNVHPEDTGIFIHTKLRRERWTAMTTLTVDGQNGIRITSFHRHICLVTGWNRGRRLGGVGFVTWYVRRACYITMNSRASGVIAEMSWRHDNITSFFID